MQLIINPSIWPLCRTRSQGSPMKCLIWDNIQESGVLRWGVPVISSGLYSRTVLMVLSTELLCPGPATFSCFTPVFLYPWLLSRPTLPQLSSPSQVIFFWLLSVLLPLLTFLQLLLLTWASTSMSHKARPVSLFHLSNTTFLAPASSRNNRWQCLL